MHFNPEKPFLKLGDTLQKRRERVKEETFTPAAAYVQEKIFGHGKNFGREKMYAGIQVTKAAQKQANELLEAEIPTEVLVQRLKDKILNIKKRGESALDIENEAFLRAILIRGDLDKFCKEAATLLGSEVDREEAKAAAGVETQVFIKLFGNSERVVNFLNVIGEASKDKYTHFSYATYYDEGEDRLKYLIDHPDLQKKIKEGAQRLGIKYKVLYAKVVDNLGKIHEEINSTSDLDKVISEIIDAYNKKRGDPILSELVKKDPRAKWRLHPGILFGDYKRKPAGERYADAPEGVEFFGLVSTSRCFLEAMTEADADKIIIWAEPRMRFALEYKENQKDLLALARRIDQEKHLAGRDSREAILLRLFENLKR